MSAGLHRSCCCAKSDAHGVLLFSSHSKTSGTGYPVYRARLYDYDMVYTGQEAWLNVVRDYPYAYCLDFKIHLDPQGQPTVSYTRCPSNDGGLVQYCLETLTGLGTPNPQWKKQIIDSFNSQGYFLPWCHVAHTAQYSCALFREDRNLYCYRLYNNIWHREYTYTIPYGESFGRDPFVSGSSDSRVAFVGKYPGHGVICVVFDELTGWSAHITTEAFGFDGYTNSPPAAEMDRTGNMWICGISADDFYYQTIRTVKLLTDNTYTPPWDYAGFRATKTYGGTNYRQHLLFDYQNNAMILNNWNNYLYLWTPDSIGGWKIHPKYTVLNPSPYVNDWSDIVVNPSGRAYVLYSSYIPPSKVKTYWLAIADGDSTSWRIYSQDLTPASGYNSCSNGVMHIL